MEKFNSWIRMVLTWIVIIPNLLVSYLALRYSGSHLEILSLGLNFICATVIFYIYIDLNKDSAAMGEDEEESQHQKKETAKPVSGLYKLTLGPLIEDISVWLCLFFFMYNIVPITLYVHDMIGKSL